MKSLKWCMWYIIATCIWLVIFPVTGITAWAFIISGPLTIFLSIVKFVFELLKIDLHWLNNASISLGVYPDIIISLTVGVLLTVIGILLWILTKRIYQWLCSIKPKNY